MGMRGVYTCDICEKDAPELAKLIEDDQVGEVRLGPAPVAGVHVGDCCAGKTTVADIRKRLQPKIAAYIESVKATARPE